MTSHNKCEICGLSAYGKYFNAFNSNTSQNGDSYTLIEKVKKISLPLNDKNSYFICLNCEDIIEELFSKFLISNKEKNKKENILPKLCEQNYHSSDEIEELPIHRLALSKFCRICKNSRFDHVRNLDCYDKNSKLILKVFKLMSIETFEGEDVNRYPKYVCHKCFLVFSKNCTNLLTGQSISKVICASFSAHKTNCSICAILTEKDLTTFKANSSEAKSSQWIHYKSLRKLCRICGSSNGKRHVSKTTDILQKCVVTLYNHKFENEDPNIYPFFVCNLCANKLNTYRYQKECNLQVNIPPLSIFKPHSDSCKICPRHSISTEICKKENFSFVEEALSITRNTALYFHMQKLFRYCRICGLPNVKFCGNKSGKLKVNEDVIKMINYSIISSLVDIQTDDPYLYPPALCYLCWTKLNINYNLKLSGRNSLIKWHVTFRAHKENCSVCSTSKYGSGIPELLFNSDKILSVLEFQSYSTSFPSVEEILLKTSIKKNEEMSVVAYGIPVDQLRSPKKDEMLSCSGCAVIPAIPIVTKCKHIICGHCIKSVFEIEHICPNDNCGQYITPDLVWTSKSNCDYINSLRFACKNSKSCNFTGIMTDVIEHQLSCTFVIKSILKDNNGTNSASELIKDVKCNEAQLNEDNEIKTHPHRKIGDDLIDKPFRKVMDFIDDFCDENSVKKDDVISFLSSFKEKKISTIGKEVAVQADFDEKSQNDDTYSFSKINRETPRKRKLHDLSEKDCNKEILSNANYNSSVSKKILHNVLDISSHECQLNLLKGSSSNVSSSMDVMPANELEGNLSLLLNSSHLENSDCSSPEQLIPDVKENILVCPALLNDDGKFNLSMKSVEPVKSNCGIVGWNIDYDAENIEAPQYLQVSSNGDVPHNDDLLSESSSDQDFSEEEEESLYVENV